jgi:hypothetical protein
MNMRSFRAGRPRTLMGEPDAPDDRLKRYALSIRSLESSQVEQDIQFFERIGLVEYATAARAELHWRSVGQKGGSE